MVRFQSYRKVDFTDIKYKVVKVVVIHSEPSSFAAILAHLSMLETRDMVDSCNHLLKSTTCLSG
jgi:hypothetical protein